ncbi:uncharacterized protein LOC105443692 isoform X2 [Strongylocentrotus purpuratus]|uniref:Death domain-containing protein n=1 Tax=Strongylocentrotus purpuratus TaxID=7668 RepID=A0A7M7NA68_STRPU|nr:uncharacterized protein LOC105443692 isoform X2 [Strongylocentrotus purpuratus]
MSSMSEQDFWRVLTHIAENMKTDEETGKLGLELGIPQYDIEGSKVANRHGIVYEGTFNMLKKWSRLQHQETSLRILRQALERVRRIDLCESMDRGESTSSIPDVAETESNELSNIKEKLGKLREDLKNYRKHDKTRPEVVRIGLYGVIGCGKSAFADSIKQAFTGTYEYCAGEMPMATQGTKIKQKIPITDRIHIMDDRGTRGLDVRLIREELIPQICGKRGVDNRKRITGGTVIHCPVFVCTFKPFGIRHLDVLEPFIQEFSRAVIDLYGRHMMVVVLHKEYLQQNGMLTDVKERFESGTGVPVDNFWIFENYTRNNHEHNDEKSIDFLKFLKRCVLVGEMNNDYIIQKSAEKQSPLDRLLTWYHTS